MSFASIKIEFLSVPVAGDPLIKLGFNDGALTEIEEAPVSVRGGKKQFQVFVDQLSTAESLTNAINLDYSAGGLAASLPIAAEVDANDDVVITATEYGVVFTDISIPAWATTTITAEVPPTPEFEIGEITVSEADGVDKCGTCRYDFTVLNSTPASYPIQISTPVVKAVIDENDQFFDYVREHVPQATLQIQPDDGGEVSKLLPEVTIYSFDSVSVVESFSGATITLITDRQIADVDITFTYSIDDVTYGASNIFYSVPPGSYTAYVLDNLGCKKSLPFTVVGVTVDKPAPFFWIEDINPFKMYERTIFSPCGERPNFNNSPIIDQGYWNIEKKNYLQLAQQCDINTMQIKSTYDNNALDIINCAGEVVDTISVNLVKQNILLKDNRDCQIKSGGDGKTNIYYISGNTYEPDTTTINGTYQISNGLLPEFASDGNIASGITIDLSGTSLNGVFKVQQSVYDNEINGYALQINAVFTGTDGEAAVTQAVYNHEDYNIYEAVIDWSLIDVGIYTLTARATDTDPRYNDVYWDGEYIDNAVEHKKSVLIKYSNPDNIEQADYSTGVEFQLRVPARDVKWRNGGDTENFISDDGTRKQLKGTIIDEIQLETILIPQYLNRKIQVASIHKELFLDGIECTLSEKGESEDKFSDRNPFYEYTAWYQFGEPIEIGDGSGIISDTGRILGVNGSVLGIG